MSTEFIRPDGPGKVTGQSRYTADLALPGMLHASFLYAGRPHARIGSIDASKARASPGVFAVLTHRDVPEIHYGPIVKDRNLFTDGIVRYEADIVAAAAGATPEIADKACRLVRVEYDDLEPVFDPEAALEARAPLVHTEWEGYEDLDGTVRNGNDCGFANIVKGDVERGLAEADLIVEGRYVADKSHPVPIEPHAVIAEWHGETVTIWSSTQVPFMARAGVAETLQILESNVRIIVPHLGGGFGGKCEFQFEAHVAALARASGRPVRLVLDRREEFLAPDMTRHPLVVEVTTGVKRDGEITARVARLVLNTGAYAAHGPVSSQVATMMAAGPYRIPNLLIEAYPVYTNTTPAGSVRAPTGPQVCWAVEQHADEIAERLRMDPLEFRLRNVVAEGDEGPTGQIFHATGIKKCLEKAAELIGWNEPQSGGETVGIACGWWGNMPQASGVYTTLNSDGTLTIVTGAQENGSGAVMGLAILAAEELGLAPDQIRFHSQDTETGLWDFGSQGSQTTFNVGRALVAATNEVRVQLLDLAAEELEASPADLELANGLVRAKDAPHKKISVVDLAAASHRRGQLILGRGSPPAPPTPDHSGDSCQGRTVFPALTAPAFFAHAARVTIDPQTGITNVREVAAAHDFGHVLNPRGAEGQVEGGVIHAVGIALTEGTVYADGYQVNPHLLDYKLQTAGDAPPIKVAFVEAPDATSGPRDLKGVGEPPVIPTAGAIANGIARSIGTRVRRLPMTPDRIWAAIQEDEG